MSDGLGNGPGLEADAAVRSAAERGRATEREGRVALSERDLEVLAWAHEQKFLTFEQVARWFPEGPPNPHCPRKATPTPGTLRRRARPGSWYARERLRKLVGFDILRRVPIFTEPAAALLPGRTGFDLLQGAGKARGLARLEAIDWKNFVHDRAVTDLRWLLEKRFGARWAAERVLRRELGVRTPPDAIVDLGGQKIALEVELNQKSTDRYLAIVRRYLRWTSPALGRVLYVVPSAVDLEHMFGKVLPAALARPDLWLLHPPDLSLFRFTTLAAIRDRKVWWTASTPQAPRAETL